MRVIFFILFCIFSFSSSSCINFEYLGNKWKQTDGHGTPIQNHVNNQQIEITIENLYHYLLSVGIPHLLTNVNNIINIQNGRMNSNSYDIATREDRALLTNIAEHLVNKGHYGYLPLKPFAHDHRRGVGRRGETLADRLELNEPRSYFNPSNRLWALAQGYSEIIKNRLTDLFFPGTVSNTFETDPEHANAYEILFNEMISEACYLLLDIRNGVYAAEEIDYKAGQRTIRIIARPVDLDGQMRNGLQPNPAGTNYTSVDKRICLYIQTSNGKVELKTAFPCRNLDSLDGGRSNYIIPNPLPVVNLILR